MLQASVIIVIQVLLTKPLTETNVEASKISLVYFYFSCYHSVQQIHI